MGVAEIIINIPFQELFFEFSKTNHIRKNNKQEIDKKELDEIMKELRSISLKKAFKNIRINNAYSSEDLKIITSNISSIQIDNIGTQKLL
jgi:hypothetical protein